MASSMVPTFVASLRAVGTASTMAFAGFYLHRRGFATASGKKMMALLSQQVTIPAFLFAKIIYCPVGGSGNGAESLEEDPTNDGVPEIVCPSVANRISDLWMLLLWPGFVVACGLLTGYLAAKLSNTPPLQTRSCLAACAFGNSTGLPITLLSVIHKQFKKNTELGRIDPTAFLSVYLLLYPVLQWGVGGWLLAPEEKVEDGGNAAENGAGDIVDKEIGSNGVQEMTPLLSQQQTNGSHDTHNQQTRYHISHLLNHEHPLQSPSMTAGIEEFGGVRYRRLVISRTESNKQQLQYVDSSNNPLAMMVRELSFSSLGGHTSMEEFPLQSPAINPMRRKRSGSENGPDNQDYLLSQHQSEMESGNGPLSMDVSGPATAAVASFLPDVNPPTIHEHVPLSNNGSAPSPSPAVNSGPNDYTNLPRVPSHQQIQIMQKADILPLTETLHRISLKVFQPPVIGALLGLFIASFPRLRGLLENIWGDGTKTAPMKWLFDGIYSVGQAAVPINMTILGINLSSTFQKKESKKSGQKDESKVLPNRTVLAVIIGKMIVMPIIGIVSTWFLQRYYIDFPDEIDATCYLVMMIVFITPTANNVMVMVELSGSSSKEGMARLIGWQYIASPVVLSVVLSAVVSLASCHFDESGKC